MKKLLSTLLLCGATASIAFAQTIVVVGKDGKSTVFNADDVKEITFE